ncbi:hypothetical protein GUJ93_ZPchr0002g26740 [Zizania palustris]|uniref:Uncharacterized protein n=1 Tax=Zizania palustris TaxID=103762 RepID=A0A8J5VRH6_ZIZPA|nr:hypothetical protein GUJ93_ZPchr0002g26740 [Zizania palustris]
MPAPAMEEAQGPCFIMNSELGNYSVSSFPFHASSAAATRRAAPATMPPTSRPAAAVYPEVVLSHRCLRNPPTACSMERSLTRSFRSDQLPCLLRRDVALYALGIGACGTDAVDEKKLNFVYHRGGQPRIKVPSLFLRSLFGANLLL